MLRTQAVGKAMFCTDSLKSVGDESSLRRFTRNRVAMLGFLSSRIRLDFDRHLRLGVHHIGQPLDGVHDVRFLTGSGVLVHPLLLLHRLIDT